jgi:hypothetical protein
MTTVTLCREHGLALLAAARGCGSRSEPEQLNFLADMLESSLFPPLRALAREYAGDYCVCCCYASPDAAINDAVAAALQLRKQYGLRPRLN